MASMISKSEYVFIEELMLRRVGHELGEGKEYLIEGRLETVSKELGLSGPAEVIKRLRSTRDATLENSAIEALMTGETSFFRNPASFMGLRRKILPDLIRARVDSRRIRLWSAGCSSGQEPYSLAILLADDFPELADWDVSILASDASEAALTRARAGSYNEIEIRRGLTANEINRHFQRQAGRWVISDALRPRVAFRKHNLIEAYPYPGEFDLILARNVLIYFHLETKRKVLGKLRSALKDDGYLLLGESETLLGLSTDFAYPSAGSDYYRPVSKGLKAV